MTAARYHFFTAAQWAAGLISSASWTADGTITPAAGWSRTPERWTMHAGAAALNADDEASWIGATLEGDARRLHRLAESDAQFDAVAAPAHIASAGHLVAGRRQYWTADDTPVLRAWLRDGLALRLTADVPADRIVDLAGDGHDGVWVLMRRESRDLAVHIDCAGQTLASHELPTEQARGLACLTRTGRLVVLSECGTRLHWIDGSTGALRFTIELRAARVCAQATVISAERNRAVIGGIDEAATGGSAWVATYDAEGDLLGVTDIESAPIDLAVGRHTLIVTSEHGVLRYRASDGDAGAESLAVVITPALQSLPAEGRAPWLRAEALAQLPLGTSLELAWAGTDDPQLRLRAESILRDAGRPPAERWHRLQSELEFSAPLRFEADPGSSAAAKVCALPLHDVRARWLWLAATVVAAPDAAPPQLISLDVLHPDESLMQHLPAIYRRQAEQPGDFLRSLVGLLETTTQGLDRRIAGLGQLLDPATTDESWLDAIAGWLGPPWDDSLPLTAKRALLAVAETLQAQRGTRSGLETLLAAVLPPGRARVTDLIVDHGYARLACNVASGARLPALLGGLPPGSLVLGRKAQLGRGRLTCDDSIDCGERFAGIVIVEVAASTTERRAWAWLRGLLDQFMPLTARLQLRWVAAIEVQNDVLHDDLRLEPDPSSHLGDNAIVGRMRLPHDRSRRLDAAGPSPGFRLH